MPENAPATIVLPLGNGISFQVENDFPSKQLTICTKDKNGEYQDLVLVRPWYGKDGKGYEILVWADPADENYTHSFHVKPLSQYPDWVPEPKAE